MQPAGNNERPPTASNDQGFCRRDWVVAGDNRVADIFFPASGNYNGTSLSNRGSIGYYWSSTWSSEAYARNLNFNSTGVNPQGNDGRRFGITVRAVQ